MPYTTDTSIQLTVDTTENTTIINATKSDGFITSNVLSNILVPYATDVDLSNYSVIVQNALTTKQDVLSFNTPMTKTGTTVSIDLSLYDTITARNTALGSYSTTTQMNTALSAKESILTFSAPLTRTTNAIGINLSLYDTIALRNTALGSYSTTTQMNTAISAKESILTFSAPLTRTTNAIGIDLSLYDTIALRNTALGSYSTTTQMNTALSAKESILTFSAPLTRTTNAIGIDLSQYAKTSQISNTWITSGSDIYYTAGEVGIGTTTASAKLDIYATGGIIGANIFSDISGYILSLKHTNLTQGLGFTYNSIVANGSGTNQDINIIPKGTGKINLNGNVGNFAMTSTNAGISMGATGSALGYASSAGSYSSSANANDTILRSDPSKQLILQSGSGGYGLKINTDNSISTSGYIGIGTANPTYNLDIWGTNTFDAYSTLRIMNNSTNFGRTILELIGRYEGGNDNWGSDRNSIKFGFKSSQASYIYYPNIIQSYNSNLGFFSSTYSATSPAFVLDKNGNIGIGNTAPTQKLSVNGTMFLGDPAYLPGTTNSTSTANTYRLEFDNSFNGTTGSGTPANKIRLHNYNNTWIGGFGLESGGVCYFSGDGHRFYSGSSGSVYGTNTFTILSNGNVGVSSTVPTQKLDVNGTVKATLFSGSGASLTNLPLSSYSTTTEMNTALALKQNSLTFSAPFYLSGSIIKLDKGNKGGSQWVGDNTTNGFGTGGDIYFVNGNVGIGTATANTKLEVNGVMNFTTGNLNVPSVGTYGNTGDRIVFWTGGASAYPYSIGMNAGTLWYSVPGGAIHSFYVNGVRKMYIAGDTIRIGTDSVANLSMYPGSQLLIDTPGVVGGAFIVNASGNVGIGVTNPSNKLEVNGTMSASFVQAKSGANGFCVLNYGGSGNYCGYLAFHNASGTRRGYIGWQSDTADYIHIASEAGCLGYKFNGNISVGGNSSVIGSLSVNGNFSLLGRHFYPYGWSVYTGDSPTYVANTYVFYNNNGTSYYLGSDGGNRGFNVFSVSDKRIKKDILEIQDNKLLALEPKQYNIHKNNKITNQYGFIAQDVKEIMPELVETSKNYIADIFDYATYSSNVLTFNKVVDLNVGDKIKILLGSTNDNNKNILDPESECEYIYADIRSVISSTEYKIDHLFTKSQVFVYGKMVNDFLSLDYNSIIALLVETTQKQQKEINSLKEILARNKIF